MVIIVDDFGILMIYHDEEYTKFIQKVTTIYVCRSLFSFLISFFLLCNLFECENVFSFIQ